MLHVIKLTRCSQGYWESCWDRLALQEQGMLPPLITYTTWDAVLQRRLAWALFVLLFSTLMYLILSFFEFSNHPPPSLYIRMHILQLLCAGRVVFLRFTYNNIVDFVHQLNPPAPHLHLHVHIPGDPSGLSILPNFSIFPPPPPTRELLLSILPDLRTGSLQSTIDPLSRCEINFVSNSYTTPPVGYSAADWPGLCFVVINPRVLSVNRVDLGFFLFHKFPSFDSPPPPGFINGNGGGSL